MSLLTKLIDWFIRAFEWLWHLFFPQSHRPPIASFTTIPTTGTVPLVVTCDASASSDPDGTIASYTYDSNGNRLSATGVNGTPAGTYDAQDRLIKYGSVAYTYTNNGALLSKSVGGQTTQYEYDLLGNLRTVTLPDGTQITYLIDGRNRRSRLAWQRGSRYARSR
jgi:YD repeat-containing protein